MEHVKPLVSICCITYNHEKYIGQAIDGFLIQETDFPIEIIIHDDASTDGTADIIRKYAAKDDRIKPILRRENIKSTGVPIFPITFKVAKGKYITMCEGDDYWTDPLKLQKQVDFLEEHPDVNWVHTDFDWLDENTGSIIKNYYKSINYHLPKTYDLKYFFLNAKGRTLTACFRAAEVKGVDKLFMENEWTVGDTAVLLYVLKDKKIGFLEDSTGVYRRGRNTASAKINPVKQFEYWRNASHKVKLFFYDYYQIDDKKIRKHLSNEYYDSMFNVAVPAGKLKYVLKSFFYKLFNFRLTKSNIGHLIYSILNIKK